MHLSEKALQVKESSTLAISAKAKALTQSGLHIINLSVGEPDFDTPQFIKDAAVKAINDGFTKYTPSSGTPELRAAICKKLKTDNHLDYLPEQIVVSNGAKHALTNIFSAILNTGDEVIIPAPYWLSYAEMVNMAGGVCKIIYTDKSNGYMVTAEQLALALTPKSRIIIVNSPNNPTGMVYDTDGLKTVADFAVKNNLYIISDEIYENLIYDEEVEHISIASLGSDVYERTIIVNGLSKSHSMTGWRVGYTASNKKLAEVIGCVQSHQTSNASSITQKAAEAALLSEEGEQFKTQMYGEFKKRREYIFGRLSNIPGISLLKPQGAFYAFVDISELCGKRAGEMQIMNAYDFAAALLEQGLVATVPCADFGFPNHIRISYAADLEKIKLGADRIEKFVNSLV